jgi:broad specificity phosphatase PhoE
MSKIIFFRHAKTAIDLKKKEWELSEEGKRETREMIQPEGFKGVDLIITSEEKKAIQTAEILNEKLQKEIIETMGLEELHRKGKMITSKQRYEEIVKKVLEEPQYRFQEWETSAEALKRFESAIKKLKEKYSEQTILIVSHGIVLTLYFGKLLDCSTKELFRRWKKLTFNAYGITEKGMIMEDII